MKISITSLALGPALASALALLVASAPAAVAEDGAKPKEKMVSGMSIVGNDDAPKALVIVPWKSSELGGALDLSYSAQLGPQPVDREVFRRALSYWEIRAGTRVASEGHQ